MASRILFRLVHGGLMKLPSRIKKPLRRALEPVLPKPEFYLVSYPKSGRTWLRMMIGAAALDHLGLPQDDPTDLERLGRECPDFPTLRITHDAESTNVSDAQIRFRSELYRSSRILFLVRDPRDVLVSFFHHQKNRRAFEADMPSFDHPDEMVDAEAGGLRSLLRFYNVWAENLPATRGYMVTHYEDLKADPAPEIRRCLEFLGFENVSDRSVASGVEQGRFDKMQAAEKSGKYAHPRLRAADPNNPASFKVRKGETGGYRSEFSPAAVERMEAIIGEQLSDIFARYKYRTPAEELAAPAG